MDDPEFEPEPFTFVQGIEEPIEGEGQSKGKRKKSPKEPKESRDESGLFKIT